jgi:Rrf2 family protein
MAYLEQLIMKLRKAGLVESSRGAHGGYRLSAEPRLVTVGEVVRALEGPIVPVECVSEQENPGCCDRETDCPSREVWRRMRDSINEVLDSTNLADLCRIEAPKAISE